MPAGTSFQGSSSATSGAKGFFGDAIFSGINFQPLDSLPDSAFTGSGGTSSRTLMWVVGGGVVVLGVAAIFAFRKK